MRTVFPWQVENELKTEFFGPLQTGFFVEVGANQPQQGSQSWQFEQAGWRGVLVEPQPDLAERLRQSRRAHVVAAACSSPANAGTAMTLHVLGPHSSLNRELAVTGVTAQSTIEVPVRTLDEILEQAGAPTPIDFVSIDVEGHEVEVLSGFDLARWRPRLLLVEDHVTSLATHRYLTRAGYRLIRRTGPNGWYVPAGQSAARRLGLVADCAQILLRAADPHVAGSQAPAARPASATASSRCRRSGASNERQIVSGAALISVIVTTYNREDALDAALRALAHQSDRNFEIVIADDGSRPDTARVIESWQARLPLPLKHVRHEHRGFRGGEIRNRGIRASAGEICIFLDGDCLAAPDFIAAHRRLYEPGWFVTGQSHSALARTDRRRARGRPRGGAVEFRRFAGAAAARRHQPFVADAAAAARAVAQAPARELGKARKPAISRWRGATSIASTASTALIPAGALRIQTLSCVSCMPAYGARTAGSRPAYCICGTRRTTARSFLQTKQGSMR